MPSSADNDLPILDEAEVPMTLVECMRHPATALLVLVPLGLVGEVFRFMGQRPDGLVADEVIQQTSQSLGMPVPMVLPVLVLVIGCLVAMVAQGQRFLLPSGAVFGWVALWGGIWAVVRAVVGITLGQVMPDNVHLMATVGDLGLAISGAIQEELLFRVGIVGGLYLIIQTCGGGRPLAYLFAVPFSAMVFAFAHTELFNWAVTEPEFHLLPFLGHLVGGLIYGAVYLRQGLAVATLGHLLYNLLAVFLVTTFGF